MLYTVFAPDNLYGDNWMILGEFTQEDLDKITTTGFYSDPWSMLLKYDRNDLLVVSGEVVEC